MRLNPISFFQQGDELRLLPKLVEFSLLGGRGAERAAKMSARNSTRATLSRGNRVFSVIGANVRSGSERDIRRIDVFDGLAQGEKTWHHLEPFQ
jgi:hypothetical protein